MVGSDFEFAFARYNANGSLDTSFSGDGRQTTDFAGASDSGSGLALQRDGKLVVAGDAGEATGGRNFALARYLGATDSQLRPRL